jgi:hypothetical protein
LIDVGFAERERGGGGEESGLSGDAVYHEVGREILARHLESNKVKRIKIK